MKCSMLPPWSNLFILAGLRWHSLIYQQKQTRAISDDCTFFKASFEIFGNERESRYGVWKTWWIRLQNFKWISRKVVEFWYFEDRKWTISKLFPGIHAVARFPNFVQYRSLKKCSRDIFFTSLTRTGIKYVFHHPQPEFPIWHFLDLVTLDDLDSWPWTLYDLGLKYAHWKLRIVIRTVSGTIHVALLTFYLTWLLCVTKPDMASREHFDFQLTCDVIGDSKGSTKLSFIR